MSFSVRRFWAGDSVTAELSRSTIDISIKSYRGGVDATGLKDRRHITARNPSAEPY